MTWPFENDTDAIVKKLAKKSLTSEKRRNLLVLISVALAAFLICFAAVISVSVAQIQRNQVADTYEAVFTGVDVSDIENLKGLPEFARVGEYYLLGEEHSGQGYNVSYVYGDSEMMYITRSKMELIKGRLPELANEVAVSEYFLSAYGSGAGIGETVRLDTESFHGDYTVTGFLESAGGGGNRKRISVSLPFPNRRWCSDPDLTLPDTEPTCIFKMTGSPMKRP